MTLVKVYLGDAVYAEIDRFGRLVLTTEDGYRATNTIVLEPEVYEEAIRSTGAASTASSSIFAPHESTTSSCGLNGLAQNSLARSTEARDSRSTRKVTRGISGHWVTLGGVSERDPQHREENMKRSFGAYLQWLFQPFFRWWWAVITGLASLLAFFWAPPAGVQLSRTGILLVSFGALTLLFLVLSTLVQAWALFSDRYRPFQVVAIQKSEEFDSGWVFLLRGHLQDSTDVLVEIRRPLGDVEVLFAIVRIIGQTSQGLIQAEPVWISPGHLSDLRASRFSAVSLIARPHVRFDRTRAAFNELSSQEFPHAN